MKSLTEFINESNSSNYWYSKGEDYVMNYGEDTIEIQFIPTVCLILSTLKDVYIKNETEEWAKQASISRILSQIDKIVNNLSRLHTYKEYEKDVRNRKRDIYFELCDITEKWENYEDAINFLNGIIDTASSWCYTSAEGLKEQVETGGIDSDEYDVDAVISDLEASAKILSK